MNSGGVRASIVANWKAEKFAQYFPSYREIVDETKVHISTTTPIPEAPVTPTEIGELLSAKLGYAKPIRAKFVNDLLIGAKLQERKERISKKTNEKSIAAKQQITCGDVILLNKTDLVESQLVKQIEDKIRQQRPNARI